jgi:spermidine synthase
VVQLAREQFRFLSDSAADIRIIEGDARLQLEAQSPQQYQLLVLDAFSGDAVPTHLLTQEAVRLCRRHLAPGGILAIHISNLHLNLRRVTEGVAAAEGLATVSLLKPPGADPETGQPLQSSPGSIWTLMAEQGETLRHELFRSAEAPLPQSLRVLWTDDYSNLLQLIRW